MGKGRGDTHIPLALDPTREEEMKAKATMTCAFLINEETEDKTILLGTKMRGKMTETEVFECVALCRDAATSVCTYFDRVLTLREREFEEISNHRREGGKVEEDDGEHRGGDKNQGGMIEIFR